MHSTPRALRLIDIFLRTGLLVLSALSVLPCFATDPRSAPDHLFIDNGHIRLGVKRSSGAGIAWLSASGSARNLINQWDRGRLVQQSYYGDADGSFWDKQPWRWNPVQGGDWRGKAATVLELKATKDSLYSRSLARHWASGVELTTVVFEQWIELLGEVAHVRFQMSYSGKESHLSRDHEVPAVFTAPDLDTLVLYDGDKPWAAGNLHRSKPGWPNEQRAMTENWAAYVDSRDFGIGVYVPISTRLTCYRFGDGHADRGACSYFAPLTQFAITPGKVFSYDAYLAIGDVSKMRGAFARLRSGPTDEKVGP